MHQYQPEYAFVLPLDDDDPKRPEEESYVDDSGAETPLTGIEIEIPSKPSKRKQKNQSDEQSEVKEVTLRQNVWKIAWFVIRWHILAYLIIFGTFYPLFHFIVGDDEKAVILQSLAFCDDWKQLIFFFGMYVTFAVKKVSDVSSVSIVCEYSVK